MHGDTYVSYAAQRVSSVYTTLHYTTLHCTALHYFGSRDPGHRLSLDLYHKVCPRQALVSEVWG